MLPEEYFERPYSLHYHKRELRSRMPAEYLSEEYIDLETNQIEEEPYYSGSSFFHDIMKAGQS